jgi:hypothetical protein
MKTVWNDQEYRELCTRLEQLTPDAAARWGRMNAPQMVCHCTDALKMVTGELPTSPRKLPIRFPPLKQLVIYALPFPKGAPTAPELLERRPQEWSGEVQALRREFDSLVRRGRSGPFVAHPAFGKLTPTAWGVLIYRHMDHHFRQFGI